MEIEIVEGQDSLVPLANGASEDHPETPIGLGEEVIYVDK